MLSRPRAAGELTQAQTAVYDVLRAMPGATIQDVAKELSLGHTTATYHLTCLADAGVVRAERDGRAVRHFLAGEEDANAYVEALMRDDRKRKVLKHLASGRADGATVNKLAKAVRLPYGFVRRTLDQLVERDYVEVVRHRGWHQVRARPTLQEAMYSHMEPSFLRQEPQMAKYGSSVAASSAPASMEVGPAGVSDFHR